MKLGVLIFIGLTLLAPACGGSSEGTQRLQVVATTTQIGDFARAVGADRISLRVLLKPNQDAHDFNLEPSQVRGLESATIVLANGLGLDKFLEKSVNEKKVVTVSQGGWLRYDDAGAADPHLWLSVRNARRMVENIRNALEAADPANAGAYRANAAAYDAALLSLDGEIRAQVQTIPPACRKLVTNHEVLGYYAEEYGLQLIGSVIPGLASDAQPSASSVAAIVARIKAENVPAIFAEVSINPALIRQVGREAGVRVVDDLYGDSLGAAGSDGASYLGMMRSNTAKIVTALRPC